MSGILYGRNLAYNAGAAQGRKHALATMLGVFGSGTDYVSRNLARKEQEKRDLLQADLASEALQQKQQFDQEQQARLFEQQGILERLRQQGRGDLQEDRQADAMGRFMETMGLRERGLEQGRDLAEKRIAQGDARLAQQKDLYEQTAAAKKSQAEAAAALDLEKRGERAREHYQSKPGRASIIDMLRDKAQGLPEPFRGAAEGALTTPEEMRKVEAANRAGRAEGRAERAEVRAGQNAQRADERAEAVEERSLRNAAIEAAQFDLLKAKSDEDKEGIIRKYMDILQRASKRNPQTSKSRGGPGGGNLPGGAGGPVSLPGAGPGMVARDQTFVRDEGTGRTVNYDNVRHPNQIALDKLLSQHPAVRQRSIAEMRADPERFRRMGVDVDSLLALLEQGQIQEPPQYAGVR